MFANMSLNNALHDPSGTFGERFARGDRLRFLENLLKMLAQIRLVAKPRRTNKLIKPPSISTNG